VRLHRWVQSALFLQGDVIIDFYRGFRFESHWVHMPGFLYTVQETWYKTVNTQDVILRLHVKLLRTAKSLRNWRHKSLSRWKLSWAIMNLTLANLEKAQEERSLTQEELEFKNISRINQWVWRLCKNPELVNMQDYPGSRVGTLTHGFSSCMQT